MILVYPESLKNAVIQDTDWLSKHILEKPARGHFFITSVNWYDTLKEKPIKMFEILKEKFGEDVVVKKFEKPKSWLNKKLSGASENQIDNLLNILSLLRDLIPSVPNIFLFIN